MLSQAVTKVNCDNEQKFTDDSVNNVRVSQSDTGASFAVKMLMEQGRERDLISAYILEGTNERAMDILRACNCDAFVPGTMFVPMSRFAEFYGVTEGYVKNILGRYGITNRKMTDDVKRRNVPAFLREEGISERFSCSYQYNNVRILCDKELHKQYSFKHIKAANFYSARVVLAFASMMYYARVNREKGNAVSIYNTLMKSSYRDAAVEEMKRREDMADEQEVEAVQIPNTQQPDSNSAILTQQGNLVLSSEFFAALIKTAVREAVSECAKEFVPRSQCVMAEVQNAPKAEDEKAVFRPTAAGSTRGRRKIVKPRNWDRVVKKQKDGLISQVEAAKLTDMSVPSYIKYSTGVKNFS